MIGYFWNTFVFKCVILHYDMPANLFVYFVVVVVVVFLESRGKLRGKGGD